ncbi:MAG: Gfo/Idh/MocA family oxidoreductase [Mariniblastus sp.]|nr:Gfo/Idh/MocA family oxidoreductase [Mariniblastus sp.]
MNPLRVAVIGAGHLGKIHARLLGQLPNVELVAVADPSPMAQKQILEQHDVQVISDFRKLLGQIDAAVVATPTRFHHAIAMELLQNSIHTLIEKPITDHPQDAMELVETAEQNHCVLSVGHVEQFNPAIRNAIGKIGIPKFIQASRMSGYTYRSIDIGVVYDLMIHDIDLVNTMFPGELVDCRAAGFSIFGGNEDMAQARLQFSCGGIANLTASRASFTPTREMQLFGTSGFAGVNLVTRTVQSVEVPDWVSQRHFNFLEADPDQQAFVREELFSEVLPRQEESVESNNAILAEQEDWIDTIRNGSPLRNTAINGAVAVDIAAQVLEQIEQHQWSADNASGPLMTPNCLETNETAMPAGLQKARPDAA